MKSKKQLIKKQAALLKETIAHFSVNPRSTMSGEDTPNCTYSGVGCAVGRLIKDKRLCRKLDKNPTGNSVDEVFTKLPAYVKVYGVDFLSDLQDLHDVASNWTEHGQFRTLSDSGVVSVKAMFEKIEKGEHVR
jgi:hypothetical protein